MTGSAGLVHRVVCDPSQGGWVSVGTHLTVAPNGRRHCLKQWHTRGIVPRTGDALGGVKAARTGSPWLVILVCTGWKPVPQGRLSCHGLLVGGDWIHECGQFRIRRYHVARGMSIGIGTVRMPSPQTIRLAASILAGDALNLEEAIHTAERAQADIISLDVSDGHFVPTLSFGEEVVRRTCQVTKLPVEVHLMVSRPQDWVVRMEGCGHFQMLFHIEASNRAMGVVQSIRAQGVRPGIAMNPETPASAVESLLPYVDSICVMGIVPGFSGCELLASM